MDFWDIFMLSIPLLGIYITQKRKVKKRGYKVRFKRNPHRKRKNIFMYFFDFVWNRLMIMPSGIFASIMLGAVIIWPTLGFVNDYINPVVPLSQMQKHTGEVFYIKPYKRSSYFFLKSDDGQRISLYSRGKIGNGTKLKGHRGTVWFVNEFDHVFKKDVLYQFQFENGEYLKEGSGEEVLRFNQKDYLKEIQFRKEVVPKRVSFWLSVNSLYLIWIYLAHAKQLPIHRLIQRKWYKRYRGK